MGLENDQNVEIRVAKIGAAVLTFTGVDVTFLGEALRQEEAWKLPSSPSADACYAPGYEPTNPTTNLRSSPNQPTNSLTEEQKVKKASDTFINVANPSDMDKIAEIGDRIAKVAGKVCTTVKEKVECVFKAALACKNKVIDSPGLKKLVSTVNGFIDYCAKNVKFTDKISSKKISRSAEETLSVDKRTR